MMFNKRAKIVIAAASVLGLSGAVWAVARLGTVAIMAWLSPAIAWAKNNIAEWHASTDFHFFGMWAVDKFTSMLWLVALVVGTVFGLLMLGMYVAPDEANREPRRRPGME